MASREKKSGGDFVLESRHLVGLFMLLVVIFGVVFTLGYLLGRSQYDTRLRAAVGTDMIGRAVDAIGKSVDAVGKTADAGGKAAGAVGKTVGAVGKTAENDSPAPAAQSKGKSESHDAAPPPHGSDWDFYHSAEPKTTEDHLQPPVKTVAAKQPPLAPKPAPTSVAAPPAPTKSAKSSGSVDGPLVPAGSIMLQVAAVTSEGDALALAQALQQKKFPAFVMTPGADKFYRVQVGPYPNNQSATAARHNLEANGFKSIIKR